MTNIRSGIREVKGTINRVYKKSIKDPTGKKTRPVCMFGILTDSIDKEKIQKEIIAYADVILYEMEKVIPGKGINCKGFFVDDDDDEDDNKILGQDENGVIVEREQFHIISATGYKKL